MPLIVIVNRGRVWRTNLTDHEHVWLARQWSTPAAALDEVMRLLRTGHRPAFQSALLDLMEAAEATATAPTAA